MKKAATLLLILIITAQAFGQRKSKSAADPKDMQIDSLTKVSTLLTLNLDSVSKELVKYIGVYDAIKEKVLYYNFDPTRSAYLIDSLKAIRDSSSLLMAGNMQKKDTLAVVLNENIMLRSKLDSLRTLYEKNKISISPEEMERAKALGSLKQLKELLDAKIITDAEFATLKSRYLQKL